MNTSMYALTRSERACLQYSIAFLVSAIFYGFLASRVVRELGRPYMTSLLQDLPVLLLISLCVGFLFTTVTHYAIRQSFAQRPREGVHD
ncbi:hypothetical protein MML63_21260 [Kosakonia sacchari]|uniref:hypothetical protein n=1 Tax=Kosakonia sacchari TaxID=1158459 RepID=UPI0025B0E2EC|nr:hypothetical protein [Kosakonia sacchari]MDN2488163.1 hypothetical protein [Kosakonia sacchari]